MTSSIWRSPIWFVVAGAIFLASVVGMAFYMAPRIAALDGLMIRVTVPGATAIDLEKPGRYTIFHEQPRVADGDRVPPLPEGLRIALVDDATGKPVDLARANGAMTYTVGDHTGVSILAFTTDHPGRYRLVARLDAGRADPKVTLAIGQGMMAGLFHLIGGGLMIAFGGLAVAGTITGLTLWQRTRTTR